MAFTREEYRRLPEGFPAQSVGGDLIRDPAPTPGHQVLISRILAVLLPIVGPARTVRSPVDLGIDEWNVFQPDIVVWSRPQTWWARVAPVPVLVVEVLSARTRARDPERKAPKHLEVGVREVWIADPDRETIEVQTVEGARTVRGEQEARSAVVPGFSLAPEALFRG